MSSQVGAEEQARLHAGQQAEEQAQQHAPPPEQQLTPRQQRAQAQRRRMRFALNAQYERAVHAEETARMLHDAYRGTRMRFHRALAALVEARAALEEMRGQVQQASAK
jgi:hypothetical protein